MKNPAEPTNEEFWTFATADDEIFDGEFPTREDAQKWADDAYAEQISDEESPRNGEEFEAKIKLIRFKYDDDAEMQILEAIDGTVNYEHYHGDFAEHNTHH